MKLQADIKFLKTCKKEHLVPTLRGLIFVWNKFYVANLAKIREIFRNVQFEKLNSREKLRIWQFAKISPRENFIKKNLSKD